MACPESSISIFPVVRREGERYLLRNYIPISLSTTDYKILAHILANIIKPILPNIINDSQTGYGHGRSIWQNIRLVQDVIAFVKSVIKKKRIIIIFETLKRNLTV